MVQRLNRPICAAAVLALWTAACATFQRSLADTDDEPSWAEFAWVSATVGGKAFDKAALYVPITADTLGGTYWLQLDTGADTDIWLYTAPLDQLLRRGGAMRDTSTWFEIPGGSIGAFPIRDHAVNIRSFAGDTVRADDLRPKIGTLGLNFFRDRVLLLDFPAERFAILDQDASLPSRIAEQASWVPIDYRDNKMFLPLTLSGATYTDFFYDSGASLFPVSTTNAIWAAATGRSDSEDDNVVWTVPSFGENVTFVGAPAQGRASVGEASIHRPMIYHMIQGPAQLQVENWGFRASGLIGNVLFADAYLVVVDLPRRRFGLVPRPVD